MKTLAESPRDHDASHVLASESLANREAILRELDNILTSRFFRSAGRCKQFLSYVVEHKLDGHAEQLKERTIGSEVFLRPPGYATGEDPVVRVQAGGGSSNITRGYRAILLSASSSLSDRIPPFFIGSRRLCHRLRRISNRSCPSWINRGRREGEQSWFSASAWCWRWPQVPAIL
jgi:hypothetical protein